jgi:HSP20 family molecular chaperone IbpA
MGIIYHPLEQLGLLKKRFDECGAAYPLFRKEREDGLPYWDESWKVTYAPQYRISSDKIEVELPGFSKKEVKVSRSKDLVLVKAKKENQEKTINFRLPDGVKVGKVAMENGLLTLSLVADEKDSQEYSVE